MSILRRRAARAGTEHAGSGRAGSGASAGTRPAASGSARVLAVVLAGALSAAGCAGGSSDVPGAAPDDQGRTELVLAASATTEPGFAAVIEGFEDSDAGADWSVNASYGPSADQSRKVAGGMRADAVSFSVEPDMTRLVDAGVVDKTWPDGATRGVPFRSVVALVVRPGNPLGIRGWSDLLRPGIEVVTPDPRSSGSAMWNMLAPYAAFSDGGADPEAGLDYVRELVSGHVRARPSSAREAADLFLQGSGDVLISYENEAIELQRRAREDGDGAGDGEGDGDGDGDGDGAGEASGTGDAVEYIIPDRNIRIDEPFAVSARSAHPDGARAFMHYLYTVEGQERFARNGFRPVAPSVSARFADTYPRPAVLYTVEELGGWDSLQRDLFAGGGRGEPGAITGIYAEATE